MAFRTKKSKNASFATTSSYSEYCTQEEHDFVQEFCLDATSENYTGAFCCNVLFSTECYFEDACTFTYNGVGMPQYCGITC